MKMSAIYYNLKTQACGEIVKKKKLKNSKHKIQESNYIWEGRKGMGSDRVKRELFEGLEIIFLLLGGILQVSIVSISFISSI